jgi:integrase
VTFGECAAAYVADKRSGWRSPIHAEQWRQSLEDYILPVIGKLPVSSIDTPLVLKILRPLWGTMTETASRVRGRIEMVLDWAKANEYRTGENPARWKGHLDHILPAPTKVKRKEHHAAMPYNEVPAFLAELRQQQDVGARALKFLILTAARTAEVRFATKAEFAGAVWTIPAARMKANQEHRVPLSAAALALVDAACTSISANAMVRVLKKLRPEATVHGFRSSFRDWAAEQTNTPNHVVEMALAHTIPSAVEAAYRRTDLMDKRRELMTAWAAYCSGQGGSK